MDSERREFDRIYRYYADRYPPLINVEQAAAIAQRTVRTIYDWSHRHLLDGVKVKQGRELRFHLHKYIQFLINGVCC
jgi:hypothetical protein